jgi:site-specific recombinase XerD
MQKDLLSITSPNYLHGRHPQNLSDNFDNSPIRTPSQSIDPRLPTFKRILSRIYNSDLPSKDHFVRYMRHKYRRNCRPKTLQQAAGSLNQFLSFLREAGKQHIEQMTREDIEAFVERQQDRGLKPRSVRTRLVGVYAFIHFLIDNKVLGYELLERRIKLKLPEQLPRAIDPEDLNQLLSVIDNVRNRAMILLLLRTGMRIGELLNTKLDDLDLPGQKILIYQSDKTLVGRVVYYSDDAKEALLNWLRVRDCFKEYLFYGRGRPFLSYESARSAFKKYLEKAGLMYSSYTLHCLRHTFATDLLNAGMRLECLQVLLGHTNLEVTRIYARLTDKTREQEYFTAMNRILKGELDADNQCDY